MLKGMMKLVNFCRDIIWNNRSKLYAVRLWLLFAGVVAIIAFVRPTERNITHHYSNASFNWWSQQDLYDSSGAGFLYFPQSAYLYAPFAWQKFPDPLQEFNQRPFKEQFKETIPLRFGEAFFRIFALLFLGWSIWNVCLLFEKKDTFSIFFPASLLAVPATITAAGNGQFNLLLAATTLLACARLANRKWTESVVWLILGIAVKPLGVVPFLLLVALNRPLWGRSIIGLVIFMALGFLHWNFEYAIRQWRLMVEQLTIASKPGWNEFDEISAMFSTFGLKLSSDFWFVIRTIAALGTLAVSYICYRRFPFKTATFLATTFAMTYLMIFNPRTETNSYLIVAPYLGIMAAMMFRDGKKDWIAWGLVAIALGLGSDNYGDFYKITKIWWKPFITCLFGLLLTWMVFKPAIIRERIRAGDQGGG